jgi:AcrR family transcriptional regulator
VRCYGAPVTSPLGDGGPSGGRDGGPSGGRDGGPSGGRDGGPSGGRDGGPSGGRDGGPSGGRDGGPSGGRDGGPSGQRGLRLDAARNQERIVAAAAAVFAELGADGALEEVARRAGVGVATVYRRFGNRDRLVRAVVAHVLTVEIEPVAAVETDDPWHDLAATLEASVAAVAAHRRVVTLAQAIGAIDVALVDRYLRRLDRLLTRARAAGLVRPELQPDDLATAVVMVLATVRRRGDGGTGDRAPGDDGGWRRYLALLLDGMRPGPAPLPGTRPVPAAGRPTSSSPASGR